MDLNGLDGLACEGDICNLEIINKDHTMETQHYCKPEIEYFSVETESIICQSVPTGGNQGTGETPEEP